MDKKEISDTTKEYIIELKEKCFLCVDKIRHHQEKNNKEKISYYFNKLEKTKKLLESMNDTKDALYEIETYYLFNIYH